MHEDVLSSNIAPPWVPAKRTQMMMLEDIVLLDFAALRDDPDVHTKFRLLGIVEAIADGMALVCIGGRCKGGLAIAAQWREGDGA